MILKKSCNHYQTKYLGMTLLELLIVIFILGILSAIAYPNYQQYILRSHRSAVMSDMARIQLALEKSKTETGEYDFTLVDNQSGQCVASLGCHITERYRLSIITGGSGLNVYRIQATPQKAQEQDACGQLILNAGGVGKAIKSGQEQSHCW